VSDTIDNAGDRKYITSNKITTSDSSKDLGFSKFMQYAPLNSSNKITTSDSSKDLGFSKFMQYAPLN